MAFLNFVCQKFKNSGLRTWNANKCFVFFDNGIFIDFLFEIIQRTAHISSRNFWYVRIKFVCTFNTSNAYFNHCANCWCVAWVQFVFDFFAITCQTTWEYNDRSYSYDFPAVKCDFLPFKNGKCSSLHVFPLKHLPVLGSKCGQRRFSSCGTYFKTALSGFVVVISGSSNNMFSSSCVNCGALVSVWRSVFLDSCCL